VQKYGTAIRAKDAHCMLDNRATDTYLEYVKYLLLYHSKNGYANATPCCVVRILSVLFVFPCGRISKCTHRIGF